MNKNSTPLLLLILLWLVACTTATPTAVSTQVAMVEIEDEEKTAVFPTNTPIPSATPTPTPTKTSTTTAFPTPTMSLLDTNLTPTNDMLINDGNTLLRQIYISPYGLRTENYCQYGPYHWIDNNHLLIFPRIDHKSEYSIDSQITQPVVIALDGTTWNPVSPSTNACDLPVWSTALKRLIESSDGEVRLRDLDGKITAVYEGNNPLHLAPSGRRLLANLNWIDLDNHTNIALSLEGEHSEYTWETRFSSPRWTTDEQRVFECCFGYGNVETETYLYNHYDWSDLQATGATTYDAGLGFTGFTSHWVVNDTRILVEQGPVSFSTDPYQIVPLIDPDTQTYEDVKKRLGVPVDSFCNLVNVAPDGERFWIECRQWENGKILYQSSYLVSLPSFNTITTIGSILFNGSMLFNIWSSDSDFLIYLQPNSDESTIGTTWVMSVDGNHWQISDEAAKSVHWHPHDPVAALRFDDEKRLQIIFATNGDSWDIVFEQPIEGIVWQQHAGATSAAIWDENGRVWQLSPPLNPNSIPVLLTPPMPDLHSIRWSPDGTKLAFVSGTDLYVVDAR